MALPVLQGAAAEQSAESAATAAALPLVVADAAECGNLRELEVGPRSIPWSQWLHDNQEHQRYIYAGDMEAAVQVGRKPCISLRCHIPLCHQVEQCPTQYMMSCLLLPSNWCCHA